MRVERLEVRALLSGGPTGAEVYLPGTQDATPDAPAEFSQLDNPSPNQPDAASATKTSSQPDDYPLPPARGPKLQGDLETQPAAMALLLPLSDSPQVLVPTLLTFSSQGRQNGGSEAVGPIGAGQFTQTRPMVSDTAVALNAPFLASDFMLLDVSKRTNLNHREPGAALDDGLAAQAGTNSSSGLFSPSQPSIRDPEQLAAGRTQALAVSEADAVEASSSRAKRSDDEAADGRAWVALAEIRPVESLKPPGEQMSEGPSRSAMPAESVVIDSAELGLAKPATADRTRPIGGVARSMVALVLASSAGLVYRYGGAVHRTSRALVRRMRRI